MRGATLYQGVDGMCLSPTAPSPNQDWGYDVCDYYGVHPDPGTLDDVDELIARAGERGIKVLLHPAIPQSRRAWGRASCSRDSATG